MYRVGASCGGGRKNSDALRRPDVPGCACLLWKVDYGVGYFR